MKVIRAEVLGMCFGVRDALAAIAEVNEPAMVTIHGQLVHNPEVTRRLRADGFAMTTEADREGVPATPRVLITAHGVSDRERSRLAAAGKDLVDTTCPLVRRVHLAAQRLAAECELMIVIGRPGHVEVQGIVEDLANCRVVESADAVETYPATRIGVVCQTTAPARQVAAVRAAIEAQNPQATVRFVDTVCLPTKDHQRALERLLEQVEAVVVVGGRNSNNTRELVALCRERGRAAYHVESADDLESAWFTDVETVGLTAGTSTLDHTIDAVERAILRLKDAAHAVPSC